MPHINPSGNVPEPDADFVPRCPRCASLHLKRAGLLQGRQRYRCLNCRRNSYGVPDRADPPPCLHCGGRCVHGGQSGSGKHLFLCCACGRRSTEQPPLETRHVPPGVTPPACHRCGSLDLVKNGIDRGKPRYKCRPCQKATYGTPAPPPRIPMPCPYCKAQCRKAGRNRSGSPRFWCPACRRQNTGLFPSAPRLSDGPYPHRRSFSLGIAAYNGLHAYCQKHGCSQAQAIRAIFRAANDAATFLIATYPPRRSHERAPEPPIDLTIPLPDLRPDAARARATLPGGAIHAHPTVYTCQTITVCLDDRAYAGLLRTMARRHLNHQDAARALLAEAHPHPGRPAF